MPSSLLVDCRHGLRRLWVRPAATLLASSGLALGVAVCASLLALLFALWWAPLPYRDGDRLAEVGMHSASQGFEFGWAPGLLKILGESAEVEAVASQRRLPALFDADGREFTRVALEPALLQMLGARAQLGRLFDNEDGEQVVVLPAHTWRQRYAEDPAIVGRWLEFDGHRLQVVGVLAEGFVFPSEHEALYVPLRLSVEELNNPLAFMLGGAGALVRLDAPSSAGALAQRLQAITEQHPALTQFREQFQLQVTVQPLRARLLAERRPMLALMALASAGVLALLLANLLALWLGQCLRRERELALRQVLGASPRQLWRLLLAELLAFGLISFLLAWLLQPLVLGVLHELGANDAATTQMAATLLPWTTPLLGALVALGFALCATRISRQRDGLAELAHGGVGLGHAPQARRAQAHLVTVQLTLAVTLLAAGALLTRSMLHLLDQPLGFNSDQVLLAPLASDPLQAAEDAQVDALMQAIATLPGVEAVSFAAAPPFSGVDFQAMIRRRGGDAERGFAARWREIGPGYFQLIDQPLLRGQAWPRPGDPSPSGVWIDRRFAERQLAGQDPLTAAIDLSGEGQPFDWQPVLGVVENVRHLAHAEGPGEGTVYLHSERPQPEQSFLLLRSARPAAELAPALRELAQAHHLRLRDLAPLQQRISAGLSESRQMLSMVLLLAACGALLAGLGLFAVVSVHAQQRRGEFALRLALGASTPSLRRVALRSGLRIALPGLLCGLVGAALVGRLLQGQLHGISALDLPSLVIVAGGVGAVTLIACLAPSLRVAGVDPVSILRHN